MYKLSEWISESPEIVNIESHYKNKDRTKSICQLLSYRPISIIPVIENNENRNEKKILTFCEQILTRNSLERITYKKLNKKILTDEPGLNLGTDNLSIYSHWPLPYFSWHIKPLVPRLSSRENLTYLTSPWQSSSSVLTLLLQINNLLNKQKFEFQKAN